MGKIISSLNVNDLAKGTHVGTLTVKLVGWNQFRVRCWLTIQLCKLAAFVCPSKLDVIVEE